MKTSNASIKPLLTAVRWTARISSLFVIAVFVMMFFGEGFEPDKITPRE